MRHVTVLFSACVVLGVSVGLCGGAEEQGGPSVLGTLREGHPRLMLTDEHLAGLKAAHAGDKALQRCVADTIARADGYMGRPAVVYKVVGPRLLSVSRELMNRVYALGLAYRWTGNRSYADKAVENMLAACAFKDWNPSHYLDTAEMAHGVGVGYDWLYHVMDEATREKVRAGLIKHGMEPGLKCYGEKPHWFVKSEHNWNQVCNGGMIVGALAIAETHPKYAEMIVPAAVRSLPLALKSYAPDGAWGEGPGYWSYATHYTAYGLTALETGLGKDFGLSKIEGLSKAGYATIYLAGPTGLQLNYADVGERSRLRPMACMFWLARTYDNAAYAEAEHALIAQYGASPQHLIWYVPAPASAPAKDLDRCFRGDVEVAVFRSAWDDSDALFVGVKAGYNQVNHGHLDLGNFELDALGERWARDLGSDDYNLPGYWSAGRGGKRWSYYRLGSLSHNISLLGGSHQDAFAKSRFLKVQTDAESPLAVVNLTEAYKDHSERSMRGVTMVEGRRAVLVQDEFKLGKTCDVTWGMTTDARITTDGGQSAVLQIGDKKLIARILAPTDAGFSIGSAEQEAPEKKNTGVRRLTIEMPKMSGEVRVAVLLSPVWKDGEVKAAAVEPLAKW
ncbi:MAG: heparinase II/III family protein [Phycisphaerae bacterium]|nr:heparinase II/III family protein [Phycisphaerae bacterium]